MKQSMQDKLSVLAERHQEVEAMLSQSETAKNQDKFRAYSQEYAELEPIVSTFRRWLAQQETLEEAEALLADSDQEMRELGKMEKEQVLDEMEATEAELTQLMLPKDPNDSRNVFLEVRAGTGGDEAAIFSGGLVLAAFGGAAFLVLLSDGFGATPVEAVVIGGKGVGACATGASTVGGAYRIGCGA